MLNKMNNPTVNIHGEIYHLEKRSVLGVSSADLSWQSEREKERERDRERERALQV